MALSAKAAQNEFCATAAAALAQHPILTGWPHSRQESPATGKTRCLPNECGSIAGTQYDIDRLWLLLSYCCLARDSKFDRLYVVLVATRNPLNIGAAARAMSNFGFLHLRVVNPFDPSFREARSAVGASELLANTEEFKTIAEAVADCTLVVGATAVGARKPQQPVLLLQEGARLIRKRLAPGRVALLFGSEKVGLSNEDLSHCHWLIRIPTRQEHRSMNLGQAVAVSLYEIARDPHATRVWRKHQEAAAGAVERIATVLLDGLVSSGYAQPRGRQLTEEKIRRLTRRLHLTAADAEVLLGMLHQIVWKLHSAKDTGTRIATSTERDGNSD